MFIQFDQVTRQFDDFTAVDNVSFSIQQGEIVGLLGHNGAGKSTIMKLLTGCLEPTQGHIYIDNQLLCADLKTAQSCIGYLPENCPLWSGMTIVEFLLYQGALKGIQKSELNYRVFDVIQKTDLTNKATQVINTLSKGYRQRVGVANSILNQPK